MAKRVFWRCAAASVVIALLAGIEACGGAAYSHRDDREHDLHQELAVQEAQLQHARDELDALDPAACPDRCRASTSICDASSRICVIARDLGDEHTMSRCERAETMCREAREVTTACGCEQPASDAGTV